MKTRELKNGFTIIGLIIVLVLSSIIVIVLISRLNSGEDQQSTSELIDDAQNAVDKANGASKQAENLLDQTSETVDSLSR